MVRTLSVPVFCGRPVPLMLAVLVSWLVLVPVSNMAIKPADGGEGERPAKALLAADAGSLGRSRSLGEMRQELHILGEELLAAEAGKADSAADAMETQLSELQEMLRKLEVAETKRKAKAAVVSHTAIQEEIDRLRHSVRLLHGVRDGSEMSLPDVDGGEDKSLDYAVGKKDASKEVVNKEGGSDADQTSASEGKPDEDDESEAGKGGKGRRKDKGKDKEARAGKRGGRGKDKEGRGGSSNRGRKGRNAGSKEQEDADRSADESSDEAGSGAAAAMSKEDGGRLAPGDSGASAAARSGRTAGGDKHRRDADVKKDPSGSGDDQDDSSTMPYADLEPFGREDTARELTEDSIRQSDAMVDQLERAEVAEEKRAVFRALTRLRGAAITSYDGIARSQTGNIDEYAQKNQWRRAHAVHHLAADESDVSRWAFPAQADF